MRYLSVCSGIEAASVAWEHLGWKCAGGQVAVAFTMRTRDGEPLTRRTLPWLYELLNQRWLNRRPILLPTNYTFEALTARYVDAAQRANEDVSLAEAIVDRLSELAPLPWIPMQGRSRRAS